jgi:hypothetical protein
VSARIVGSQRGVGLARGKGVGEGSNGFGRRCLGPDDAKDLAEVSPQERIDSPEHRFRTLVYRAETEVRVDDVDTKRRILDERGKDFFPVKAKGLV